MALQYPPPTEPRAHRVQQVEELTIALDRRSWNNAYRTAMIEAADYEGHAELALSQNSSMDKVYAAMATMKYAKAAAIRAGKPS